jgi:leader peptidase (prepilin peptidase)/N-methyltransferase
LAIHITFIIFFFILGSCIGSFLNVVVWRLPRGEFPGRLRSRCPKCETDLAWYDNIPVFGWIALRGKCRYCKQPISPRYPIIEAITGALFVVYYVAFFISHEGPCGMSDIIQDWPMYGLYMLLISALLGASLIDAELFIVPIEIPWFIAAIGMLVHAIIDMPHVAGALNATAPVAAMSAGAGAGLVISIVLLRRGLLKQSFAEGGPLLEFEKKAMAEEARERDQRGKSSSVDYESPPPPPEFTPAQIRAAPLEPVRPIG